MPSPLNTSHDLAHQQALMIHRTEREAWLAATRASLEADQRIDAAWLFGSLGRGDDDALSDIDLFVIVADEHFDSFVAQRFTFMAQTAQPLLILEAPQNWPPGGVYNMALYSGTYGPHQVDWYWVRRSFAQIPSETRVLFDRLGLQRLDQPTHFDYATVPDRLPEEIATQTFNMFWVMWLITAKYTARRPWHTHDDLFSWTVLHLQNVATFAEITSSVPKELSTLDQPSVKIQYLQELAATMEVLMPQVMAKGITISESIVCYAKRYLHLVEAIVADAIDHDAVI